MSLRAFMHWLLAVSLLALFACQPQTPGAGASRPPGANYEGKAFSFQKIQDDIYQARGTGNLAAWCNIAIIINTEDVLIVDSHISPAAAWVLLEELKSITSKPVRYVINTHFHFDHLHGNQIFSQDVEIIGHEFTREMVLAGESNSGRTSDLFLGGLPDKVAELQKQVDATTDSKEKTDLQKELFINENFLAAVSSVKPTPPNVTLNRSMTLYRGGREIRLLFLGRGHTAGDVVVYLPKERVLVTGDLLTAGLAYMGDGFLKEWAETLERLKNLDVDVILPGHGGAFTDIEKIDHFQAYLLGLWDRVAQLHRQGISPEEAARRIDMRSHAKNFPSIQEVGVHPQAVLRAYELLDGQE